MDRKETKDMHRPLATEAITRPIGTQKAARFSEVDGLQMRAASRALVEDLRAQGLSGEAYRSAIARAFRNRRSRHSDD